MGGAEAKEEREVVRFCQRKGWLTVKLTCPEPSWPDRLVLLGDGLVAFVEMKKSDGHPSPSQSRRIDDLISRGYHADICYSAEEAISFLETVAVGGDTQWRNP